LWVPLRGLIRRSSRRGSRTWKPALEGREGGSERRKEWRIDKEGACTNVEREKEKKATMSSAFYLRAVGFILITKENCAWREREGEILTTRKACRGER
jgi:hypothetical protein